MEEAIEEMKKLRDISKDVLFLQNDNAIYHWSIDAIEFYYESNIKIIDWPPYSPDLNPIENIWPFKKRKIALKTSMTINSLKWTICNMERTWLWRHKWAFMTELIIALRFKMLYKLLVLYSFYYRNLFAISPLCHVSPCKIKNFNIFLGQFHVPLLKKMIKSPLFGEYDKGYYDNLKNSL